jgi:hypothetical protein
MKTLNFFGKSYEIFENFEFEKKNEILIIF